MKRMLYLALANMVSPIYYQASVLRGEVIYKHTHSTAVLGETHKLYVHAHGHDRIQTVTPRVLSQVSDIATLSAEHPRIDKLHLMVNTVNLILDQLNLRELRRVEAMFYLDRWPIWRALRLKQRAEKREQLDAARAQERNAVREGVSSRPRKRKRLAFGASDDLEPIPEPF